MIAPCLAPGGALVDALVVSVSVLGQPAHVGAITDELIAGVVDVVHAEDKILNRAGAADVTPWPKMTAHSEPGGVNWTTRVVTDGEVAVQPPAQIPVEALRPIDIGNRQVDNSELN